MCPVPITEINFEDDLRFVKAKIGLKEGAITTFEELFKVVPKTTIARKLKINPPNFKAKVENLGLFRMWELQAIARMLDIDFLEFVNIIYAKQVPSDKN
ncbi:hypothetical protein [Adhaeribacter aquaticus]|uniref:hypothetical protein n=1 Tax=Adhaeribacter aquaticus TaxID=299567 RepID=UPI0003FD29AF|nr:hypothetical protein [Adhaeribacter aquaticus]